MLSSRIFFRANYSQTNNSMDKFLAWLEKIINRLPGPGKMIYGGLTQDRDALRALIACMAAIFAGALQPPVLSLYVADVQQGLRDPGSGVPIQVAAAYLLLAVLTLVGGASGDIFGRKRFMMFGLTGVLATNVLGMFFMNAEYYNLINAFNSISNMLIMPMAIAIVTLAFPLQVRPFAYGAVFACQSIGLVAASSVYGILAETNYVWFAFVPAILLCVVAMRLVARDTRESRAPRAVSIQELILNLVWASAIFGLVYGLLAFGKGPTSFNMFVIVAICLLGFVIGYRWIVKRMRKTEAKLYNVRDLSFAIFAGIMLSLAQGAMFYQLGAFFQKIQSIGPVMSGLGYLPFILSMMIATLFIVRLSMYFGARRIISGGLVLMGIGLVSMFFVQATTPYWQFILPLLFVGFGLGTAAPARTTVVLTISPPGLTGMAAGVNTAAGQSGFAAGTILSSVLVTFFADRAFVAQLTQINAPPAVIQAANKLFQETFARAISGNLTRLPDELAKQIAIGFGDAFAQGMAMAFVVIGILMFLSAAAIFLGMNKGLKATFISQPLKHAEKTNDA